MCDYVIVICGKFKKLTYLKTLKSVDVQYNEGDKITITSSLKSEILDTDKHKLTV